MVLNFFDTAQGHGFGASERLRARALEGRPRDQLVIATNGGLQPAVGGGVERDSSPDWVRRGVDESLKALGTDYIDLYQVHWLDPKTPFAETAGALADFGQGRKDPAHGRLHGQPRAPSSWAAWPGPIASLRRSGALRPYPPTTCCATPA